MFRFGKGGVWVTGGFCLLTAWFGLVNGWRMLALELSAAALHELGHWLALRCMGACAAVLRVSVFGAEMEPSGPALSYGRELLAVLAGPAVNLFCGVVLAGAGQESAAGIHLVLCLFNLLPVRCLDGGRALCLLVSWTAGPAAGEWAVRWIGGCCALSLATILFWLMYRSGGSLWLLPAALGLLEVALGELFAGMLSREL